MRGLIAALALLVQPLMAQDTICTDGTGGIAKACYHTPDGATVYGHGILGDTPEWTELHITLDGASAPIVKKQARHIFEDVAPRVVDVDGDGMAEVVVVESSFTQGGRLAIYSATGKLVDATPYIGRRNRWLAPITVADLDGNGTIELAYIDRPHLAKTLKLWTFEKGKLRHLGDVKGLTNHRIGEADIAGGLRDCGMANEMVVASADWRKVYAVSFNGKTIIAREIGDHKDRTSFSKALACLWF